MSAKNSGKHKLTKPAGPVSKPTFTAILRRLLAAPLFSKVYVLFSLVVLMATTLYWAYKSAAIQLNNADQLVDPYFFTSHQVFQATQFPSAHTFIVKWPLFYLIRLLDFTANSYTWLTVLLVCITVGGLVLLLRRIERRPMYLGTLVLALASVLLLIPAEPYAGALLPVNMSMLATRNIEYLLYIGSLIFIVRSRRLFDWRLGVAMLLQVALFASDKLFLVLSLGGGIICLLAFALDHSWKLVLMSSRWLLTSLLAAGAALLGLALLNSSKLTHMAGGLNAGPYELINNSHGIIIGAVYALANLLTNFGANPAYDVGLVRQLPQQFLHRFLSLSSFGFLVNLVLFGLAVWAITAILRRRFRYGLQRAAASSAEKLAYALLASSVTAIAFFVGTNHYYFVDGRYLAIVLFALFVSLAVWLRRRQFNAVLLVMAGGFICLGIGVGLWSAHNQYRADNAALSEINHRNNLAAQALKSRPEQAVIGDYWRVLPIRFIVGDETINVLPMENCDSPRTSLTSTSWNLDLHKHSFAYLLPLDKGPAGFPECSLQDVVRHYGQPDASTVIEGTYNHPVGLLLFYDHGIAALAKQSARTVPSPASITPIGLSDLPQVNCRNTYMNIVAHQDDDLLFLNPDIYHSIQSGDCQRTVYLTAGDAGFGQYYWLGRERGSQAAYDEMVHLTDSRWDERVVKLTENEYVTVASPSSNDKISLLFMHLPDGNLWGQGFRATNYESLAKLDAGKISLIHSVDGQSSYTAAQLTAALNQLMQFYQPDHIRTQANYISKIYPDHSDHMAVGRFVKHAVALYDPSGVSVPLQYYIGYPERAFPPNVSAADIQQTLATFIAYAVYDSGVCHSAKQCNDTLTYGSYISRQYTNPY